ncbi:MAG TPA: hypothetical protein VI893_10375, partial [Thermoplasmata archaeon]|nr:hypothetical protein [Thermoplasmata archaeon]
MRAGALAAFVFFLPLVGALLSGATPPGPDDAVLDDFNDGNYTGGLAAWTVQAGSWSASSLELRNQPTASTNYRISTPQAQAQGSWQWSFRHNASAGLNDVMRFHFMQSGSSDAELSSGYYVFSNTANNFYKLIRWSGGVATDLIATTQALGTSWHTARVDRGVGGGFAFYYGASLVGTLIDDTFLTTSYLGVRNSAGSTDDWVAIDDIQFTASTATPPTVTVNAPNGGETWYQKGSYPITWSTAQGTNPLKASPINIFYGTGVNGPWTLLAGPLADTGSWTWNVPSAFVAGSYYIRVRAEDNAAAPNVGYDRSDAAFTIAAPTAPSVTVTKPTGGESLTAQAQYGIQYTASQGTFPLAANPIAIDYSTDGGTTWLPIVSGQANSGTYTWAVPNTVVSNAIIRVCANDDRSPATTGCGQVTFNIVAATPPSATVQQPNGGETWGLNGTYQIKWAASAGSFPLATNPFTVFVSITGLAGPWTTLASGLSALTYNWLVNVTTSNDSYIRVCAKDDRP